MMKSFLALALTVFCCSLGILTHKRGGRRLGHLCGILWDVWELSQLCHLYQEPWRSLARKRIDYRLKTWSCLCPKALPGDKNPVTLNNQQFWGAIKKPICTPIFYSLGEKVAEWLRLSSPRFFVLFFWLMLLLLLLFLYLKHNFRTQVLCKKIRRSIHCCHSRGNGIGTTKWGQRRTGPHIRMLVRVSRDAVPNPHLPAWLGSPWPQRPRWGTR